MSQGLSIREFARRDGCSDTLVRRAIKQGRLNTLGGGTLDPALIGTGWRDANAKGAKGASANTVAPSVRTSKKAAAPKGPSPQTSVPTDDELAKQAQDIIDSGDSPHDYGEALRRKENFLALLRELEYGQKSGRLIELERAERVIFECFRGVRDAWLNWPTRVGPLIAADLGCEADRVTEILNTHVHKQLSILGDAEADFSQD